MLRTSLRLAVPAAAMVASDLLPVPGDEAAVHRVTHTISAEPEGCCACDTQQATRDVVACVKQFAARRDCQCRLDLELLTNYFYLCRNHWKDTWMYEENAMLTGGPYDDALTVDSVRLGLLQPWSRVDVCALWPSLWAVNDADPCAALSGGLSRTYVPARFDMAQYVYTFTPDQPTGIPAAWSFTAETEDTDACAFYLKDVTTRAHLVAGAAPRPQLDDLTPYNFTRDGA